MPTVHFLGRILPQTVQVTLDDAPSLKWESSDIGLIMEFKSHIIKSQVDIECTLNRYTPDDFIEVHKRAIDICRATVDLACFNTGRGLTVTIESFVDPNGSKSALEIRNDYLAKLCTAFTLTSGFAQIHNLVLQDWRRYRVLNDLIRAITEHHVSTVNCARAIEGLRHLIASPDASTTKAWKQMRETLRIDKAYLKFITDHSVDPRHGKPTYIPGNVTSEVTRRAWVVMNRYFEYLKNGERPLSETAFPMLADGSAEAGAS
jgi:hypothetical protein